LTIQTRSRLPLSGFFSAQTANVGALARDSVRQLNFELVAEPPAIIDQPDPPRFQTIEVRRFRALRDGLLVLLAGIS
jgi:hypothetical protein